MVNNISISILFTALSLAFGCYYDDPKAMVDSAIDEYQAFVDKEENKQKMAWPSYADTVVGQKKAFFSGLLSKLNGVDPGVLSVEDRINYDMLFLIIEDERFHLDFESYLMPLNAEGGFLANMIYATNGLVLHDDDSRLSYLSKLESTPAYLDEKTALLRRGLEVGKTLPALIVKNCIGMTRQFSKTPVEDHFLFAPLRNTSEDIYNKGEDIIVRSVLPAFIRFTHFLENDYLPKTRSTIGIGEITEGHEYYAQRVRYFTTLDMSPEEIFETGKQEVARIRKEMEAVIALEGFEGSFDQFLDFLRRDPQFYATTPEQLLNKAAWLSKKAEEFLPRYFGLLPRLPFTVSPVPDAIAPNYTGGRYSPGSYKDHRAGAYWVNTYNLQSRPLYVLPALTLHEAVPGHHLQGALAQEMKNVPKFRQDTYLSAYGEGWALYCEYLGKEAGYYTTPYEEFGRLTYEMWRACRLVVDPGMHVMGWSRQKAIDFMSQNTALSLHEINTEIDRYIGWPGQAVSYKIGELKIRELREKAENALGKRFDLRAFHDILLQNGSVPLFTLEVVVDKFIQQESSK